MKAFKVPGRYALAALLVASVGAIAISDSRAGERSMDPNISGGVVVRVLSERAVTEGPATRADTEQTLLVELDGGRRVTAINDLVGLQEGSRGWFTVASGDRDSYLVQPERTRGLTLIAAVFAMLVMTVAGWHGVRALIGMVATLAVVLVFLVPAILAGTSPVLAGLVSALAILTVTLWASHGINRKSAAAFLGIIAALAVVALLAQGTAHWLRLTGFGSEEVLYLGMESSQPLNLVGLLVAGIIIAAIGVLDDVAVTQVSVVWQLAAADAGLRGRRLFTRAMEVGKDHIAAVVNTLVLAYVGAALPLILLLQLSRFPVSFILSGDVLAEEIVLTLLSSFGLVLAVPLATAVAVIWVDRGVPAGEPSAPRS